MKVVMLLLTAMLVCSMHTQAQNMPATARLADDNGQQQLFLNTERAAGEDEPGGVTSVWIYDKRQQKVTLLLTSNPDVEGAWDRMEDGNTASVSLTKVAAADRAWFVPGEGKIIVEGCPDARNVWSYIIDLQQKTVCQLSSNAGFVGFAGEDETYVVMQSYRYNPDLEVGGRFPVLRLFTTDGRFFKEFEVR